MSQQVYWYKFREGATLPTKATKDSAAYDLYAWGNYYVNANNHAFVKTGLNVYIPKGYCLDIKPRSGLANKRWLIIPNSPGLVDEDYCGIGEDFEVRVGLYNLGDRSQEIKPGDRIAQVELRRVEPVEHKAATKEYYETLLAIKQSKRKGGFGSTGKSTYEFVFDCNEPHCRCCFCGDYTISGDSENFMAYKFKCGSIYLLDDSGNNWAADCSNSRLL